jgi:hypothetical protein
MSVYNVIIWSLQKWSIDFEMLNHDEDALGTADETRCTGFYKFKVRRPGRVYYVEPRPSTLKVHVRGYRTGKVGRHMEEYTIDLYDPGSLRTLRAILTAPVPPCPDGPGPVRTPPRPHPGPSVATTGTPGPAPAPPVGTARREAP